MNTIGRPSKLRSIVLAAVLVTIGCALVVVVPMVRHARQDARRSAAYGHLSQMRLALQNYESRHGTLPPLCLRNKHGKPILSWRALVLPYVDAGWLKRLHLDEPWNSDHNRTIVQSTPLREWACFARDRVLEEPPIFTHILALLGADSIWDATTGVPKGTTREYPNAILLISVPESRIEPLQPGDITETEVRKMVEDGEEVLFIMAGSGSTYGVVTIEGGRLAFHTWQEVLERSGRAP